MKKESGTDFFVHQTAIVEDGVEIGKDTKIWHWSKIREGSKIGEGCSIGSWCEIGPGVTIGKSCRIGNRVDIFEGITIEDYVFVAPNVAFTNDRNPNSYGVSSSFDEILIKRGAMIGANATIVAPCVIGREAFIGAGCVVTKDIPDGTKVVGNPAKRARRSL